MGFPARLRQATLLSATLFLSTSPGARTRYIESLDPQQAHEFDRVHELMVPLAQAVLQSADAEELEANIESQLFSGLFADIVTRSMAAVMQLPPPTGGTELFDDVRADGVRAHFLDSVSQLGVDRRKVNHALDLTLLSSKLGRAIMYASANDGDGQLVQLDLADSLYDIGVPLELREAAYADFQAAICMIAIAYAAEHDVDAPRWLVEDLVDRWVRGQRKSLPAMWALAIEHDVSTSDELQVELDKLFEQEGVEPLDLDAAWERTGSIAEQLETIAAHANRQPDGVWSKRGDIVCYDHVEATQS